MRLFGRRAALAALAFAAALGLAQATYGHALLQSSDPAAGGVVAAAPAVVKLTFGEAPDPQLSSVNVLDSSGRNVAAGRAVAVAGKPDELDVPVGPLPAGIYTVAWRTVSAVDGHTAAGSFAFGVGVAPSAGSTTQGAGAATSPNGSLADTIARLVLYAGLIGLFGAGFIGALIHPRPPRSLVWLAVGAWIMSAVGSVLVTAVQAADSGAQVGDYLGSSLGVIALGRVLAAAATAVAVAAAVLRRRSPGRATFAPIVVTAIAAMAVDVVSGHAAVAGVLSVDVAIQLIHFVAAGAWMGGLAALLLSIRGPTSDERAALARGFSRWAGLALAAIALTGFVRAVQEVGTVDALFGSDYGRLVVAKSVLLVVLALLGAVNHFVSVPAAVRNLSILRRVGRVELSVGLVVLGATALLVNVAPPASGGATPNQVPQPVLASGSDFGTSVRLHLTITPGTPGSNHFEAGVTDYDSGAPANASNLSLRFTPASEPGVAASTLTLAATAPGTFAGDGTNLSLDGIWSVTAVVGLPSGAVEVPLALATLVPAQAVQTNAASGVPTIYTVSLNGGNSVQVYLDPGSAGANTLHVTFFDSAGKELAVPAATILIAPAAGPSTIAAGRELEPGHFVSDVQAASGSLPVDVVGHAPDGSTLHAHVEIAVG